MLLWAVDWFAAAEGVGIVLVGLVITKGAGELLDALDLVGGGVGLLLVITDWFVGVATWFGVLFTADSVFVSVLVVGGAMLNNGRLLLSVGFDVEDWGFELLVIVVIFEGTTWDGLEVLEVDVDGTGWLIVGWIFGVVVWLFEFIMEGANIVWEFDPGFGCAVLYVGIEIGEIDSFVGTVKPGATVWYVGLVVVYVGAVEFGVSVW